LKQSLRALKEKRVASGLGDDERRGQSADSERRQKNPM
jgi:hypothetical protein